ncbi:MAG: DUF4339 domain-containing protein [Chitinophagaceae bacterium]|nr:DUF4339 domain-containing protein [Chitinophagaceae bacterium]
MNKYLLLRDNKQTGPYTAEELAKKGLKPYDLVWLEGRSAAWRYPSEMEELRSFAPAVEEQPYDRFYKRSSSAQEHAIHAAEQAGKLQQQIPAVEHTTEMTFTATAAGNSAAQTEGKVAVQPLPVDQPTQTDLSENKPAPTTGSGKVYVTLPAGFRQKQAGNTVTEAKTNSNNPVEKKAAQPVIKANEQQPVASIQEGTGVSKEAEEALEARAAALAQYVQQAAAEAATKRAAQSILSKQSGNSEKPAKDQKKEEKATHFSTLIDTVHQEEKVPVIPARSSRKHVLLMRGIVAACLLLGGIVIGMALTYSNRRSANQEALDQLVQRLQEREAQRQAMPLQASDKPELPPSQSQIAEEIHEPSDQHSIVPPKQEAIQQQVAVREKPVASPVDEPPVSFREKDPSTMKITNAVITHKEEPRPVRDADLSVAREKIYQMVQVAASPFKTGVLGGISNLYFTISNTSSFPLDQIELEVKYLGPEKRVVKVQRLLFTDVAAGGQKTLEAPRTARGVSIDYVVTKINSRALGIAHAGF